MTGFKNDKDIVSDLIQKIDSLHQNKSVFLIIPEIVLMIEREYKPLRGEQKKYIALKLISHYALKDGLSEQDIESLLVLSPYMINGLVYIAKNSKKIFEKSTRFCCKK